LHADDAVAHGGKPNLPILATLLQHGFGDEMERQILFAAGLTPNQDQAEAPPDVAIGGVDQVGQGVGIQFLAGAQLT
jgi:hypothetical protein